jgi:predicted oxidoreductase (fatty acid repression mutant protein)
MDLFAAIKGRRSCRNFLPEPISEDTIEKILEAATWAPSPLNSQPWEFIVITNQEVKEKVFAEADRCRKWTLEKSGWKWAVHGTGGFEKLSFSILVFPDVPAWKPCSMGWRPSIMTDVYAFTQNVMSKVLIQG